MTENQLLLKQNFSYLENLNPAQREAVELIEGPVLVLAGAGTGKTRVLTTRLGHILSSRLAWPSQILSVTFTNKAAMEMKKRVAAMLNTSPSPAIAGEGRGEGAVPKEISIRNTPSPSATLPQNERGDMVEGMWLGTFHSIAARMLRRHAEIVGLKSNFSILDDDDQIRLLKALIESENIDAKKWPPRLLLSFIQRWKDRGLLPDQVNNADGADIAGGRLPRLYTLYQSRLRTLNACDFGDLLLHMIAIFRDPKNADVLEEWQNRFKYILVDEYQDTNAAQYIWLRLLAQRNKNICCVGDDDQSIYGWRGADIGNILKFEQDFPGAKIVRLEQNYRSTKHILSAANGIIARNRGRLGKNLWSEGAEGEQVSLRGVWDGQQEAQAVAEEIGRLQRIKTPLSQIAVLVRAGHQTREFEERFIRESIPYKVIGGLRFYERQEIRDAIAYLRVLVQPDDDLAFERIMNVPKRGLGDATLQIIHKQARESNISLHTALRDLLNPPLSRFAGEGRGEGVELQEISIRMTPSPSAASLLPPLPQSGRGKEEAFKPKPRDTLKNLMRDFDRWRSQSREIPHAELAGIILDESGYMAMWKADKSPEAAGRLDNLKEFVTALAEFETLEGFLEHVSLVMDTQEKENSDMVSIMTLHAAKGLEFDIVFLPGWEEGVFPNQRTMDETGAAGLEEERRLAYVGLTRARKKAYISFAANRLIYGNWTSCLPSRFIDELPKDNVCAAVETGLYRQQSSTPYSHTRGRPAQLVDAEDDGIAKISAVQKSQGGFSPGDKVFHQKFGTGVVLAVEGDKLDINFAKAGRKKIMESFVEAA